MGTVSLNNNLAQMSAKLEITPRDLKINIVLWEFVHFSHCGILDCVIRSGYL